MAAVLKVQTWILQKVVHNSPKDSLLKGNVNSFIRSIDKISTVKPFYLEDHWKFKNPDILKKAWKYDKECIQVIKLNVCV